MLKENERTVREAPRVDSDALARSLRSAIEGEVRFDPGSRALYATDASNYRQVPIGVVLPKTVEDVIETVAACRRYGAPVLSRGGGTSLSGQTCNIAVVMDMSKYLNRILELNPEQRRARVQPGLVLDDLRSAAEKFHLTFAPDPSTHRWCTLGGMIGNNSCGVHSVMGGKTEENVEELDILTYDGVRMRVGKTGDEELERFITAGGRAGEIYRKLKSLRDRYADAIRERYVDIPRRVSGFNLLQLLPEKGFDVAKALVGTEGTCVTVLEATVRLVSSPPKRSLLVLGYPDVFIAGDRVTEVLAHRPVGLEGMDDMLIENLRKKGLRADEIALLPEGGGWLLAEFGGETQEEAHDQARRLMEELNDGKHPPAMKLYDDLDTQLKLWETRESGLSATAIVPGEKDKWEGWEDSAVPPDKVGAYLRDLRKLYDKYGFRAALYGHFGDGCIHTRIDFDLITGGGIESFRQFLDEAADAVLRYGGSLSGEHGDGQATAELLPKMYGEKLVIAFQEFKAIWDPDWKMNPGKVVLPHPPTKHLRLGTRYRPPQLDTHFQYPDDDGSFSRATLRCVGIGKCRQLDAGTMCPSYMATHEEKHTTRGRARLLFEMLEGDTITGGWRDEHVKEALDLCLACKGCKGECPVNVDIATYKAEFFAHYYKGRLRPLAAYAMGLIHWWARLASWLPGVANFLTQAPLASRLMKAFGGLAAERRLPPFSSRTFLAWFHGRRSRNHGSPRVLLWPDTFNNHFFPETARAAVEVLEAAGFYVAVPKQPLCCGRPLYDFGMLSLAKSLLRNVLTALEADIIAGTPIVCLEPSCAAVFRDELINLFPYDQHAQRLRSQVMTLSEFLEDRAQNFALPTLHQQAVVHGHCHQKAVLGMKADCKILEKLGLNFTLLDSGCCGMSGSFGFNSRHYGLSMQIGERVLLPAVRKAPKETLVIADGFSCREQIAQSTDRRALHLAQVLQMALHEGPEGPPEPYPESRRMSGNGVQPNYAAWERALLVGVGLAVIAGTWWWTKRKRNRLASFVPSARFFR
ncbi:MAG: FAD-binding protein [Nitrospira sp.]|nr:FAD-binding protein [Nitrospira sp.]